MTSNNAPMSKTDPYASYVEAKSKRQKLLYIRYAVLAIVGLLLLAFILKDFTC